MVSEQLSEFNECSGQKYIKRFDRAIFMRYGGGIVQRTARTETRESLLSPLGKPAIFGNIFCKYMQDYVDSLITKNGGCLFFCC